MESGLATLAVPESLQAVEERSDHPVHATHKGAVEPQRTSASVERLAGPTLAQRCLDYARQGNIQGMRRLLDEQGVLPEQRGELYRSVRQQATIYG